MARPDIHDVPPAETRRDGVHVIPTTDLRTSVLINAFNYRRFVGEAIESALNQTQAPLEVLVVDDGSTDGTADWVESSFASRDNRVRVMRQANAGQLAAMGAGVCAARGDILFFLDADDTWASGYLAGVLKTFEQSRNIDYVFAGHVRSDGLPSQVLGEKGDRVLGRRSAQAFVTGKFPNSITSTLAMRAALARRFLPAPAEIMAEWKTDADQVLALGAALAGGCGAFVAGDWVNYRIHGGNHFAGRAGFGTPEARAARAARAERARRALIASLSLGPETADRIADEFASIERPKWRECRRALKAATASPGGFAHRCALRARVLGRFIFAR